MDKVEKLLQHEKFLQYMKANASEEEDRRFCVHDMQHVIDTARVAYILALEKGYPLDKEVIYITSLLHDIGKWKQYRYGCDHAVEGALLAEDILEDIGVELPDRAGILEAIREHRNPGPKSSLLGEVLYGADKSCRLCSLCPAAEECKRFGKGKVPVQEY